MARSRDGAQVQAAKAAGKNSRALQGDLVERFQPPAAEETYPHPRAATVRTLIRYAMSTGWLPEAVGGTFHIPATASVTLPGFAVTELLAAPAPSGGS
ncbi:hypothetical protein GCM10009681_45970 [Luedemannella helvata]|uniref:Uncharacterized protein n=1 Tax=Luedemannella helvata TaxID=349315 RepID=A0ABP4X781_9ACTN